jgi:hypothetical protein
MAKKSDPEMFKNLSRDESWLLRLKLGVGASQASMVIKDYALSGEINESCGDLHTAWEKYLKGK